ncbi:hypothetical protein [Sulfitobacter donghicola]|uniref:Uncharacterized protein n=1 Tax=Sulfitobacter donghicola DSW-25 = KCTC 12864 = JCM 14565 TaxID=1300350 RepID=A0A073IF60_9RHOB|nr:hypothetical protein [Sulfitobacter donghicola]KEJ88404.1 hypothetical protein DSW25_15005 [Sulfitobacter donghicola DSW-25 = KCTC 12864 = JCM 14565]KIN69729.1 hypothetical protein Z948_3478 [Sulfitobacter donghicola DSW-25 = KCTC 12864 = JCM 14565]
MLDIRHLLRAKRWAQNPPSAKRVKLVLTAIALALLIVGLEHFGFWPEWAKAERLPRRF